MHRKYGKDGVVVISVSVDQPETKPEVLEFLKKQKATMLNYWLDDPEQTWFDKWNIGGTPAAFVFDQQGRRVKKFTSDDPDQPYTAQDVEDLVKKLVDKKP
jgi:peroxiredoxin